MQVNPYLFYNGNCEEALKYYQKALGAQIEAMMPYGDGPADTRSRRTGRRSSCMPAAPSMARC